MKKLIGLFVVLLFCTSVLALSPSDLTWNGLGQIHLDKSTYDANEPITGSVYLSNLESFPIVSGKIIFQIAQGDYVYPSQESADNLVEEAFISDIWALPNSTKKIDFVLPAQRSGDYRLDIYAWVVKSKLIGSSSILYNPISKSFSVKGTAEKRVVIDRKKTVFGSKDTVGPVGFAVNLDEEFNGVVVVRNDSGKAQKNLELEISMCYWAIPFCDDPETFKFPVENLSVNEEKQIDVNLLAPLLSSAYEINIVLKSEKGIESMYKNRIIVMGPTAEARKVFLKGLGTKNYSISVVFAGSPDHFSNPVFENFTVATEALVSGKVIERKTADVFSLATGEIINQDFPLNSKFFDEVCVKAEKAGIVYEEECFSVDLEAIENAYDDKLALPVSVSWNYLENNSSLEIKLRKALINARIILLDGENTIYEEQIKNANSEITKALSVEKKNYTLIVDDFDVKKQQVFDIRLMKEADLSIINQNITVDKDGKVIDAACLSKLCGAGFVCNGKSYATAQGSCCMAECVPALEKQFEGTLPFIVVAAIILGLAALVVVISTYNRVRK